MNRNSYDAVGNRISEQQPNGIRTEYAYNANNQLIYMAHYRQNTLLDEYRYTVDAAGQRVALEEIQYQNGQPTRKTSTWQYDAIGRLTNETTPTQSVQYQHDAVGNVLQKVTSLNNGGSNITTNYSYDVNDRLLSENKAGQVTNYTYDNQGNTLTQTHAGQTKSYVYNSQNQLIKTTLNGQQLQFSYDADGIRNSKSVNGQVTSYVVDKTQAYAQVIAEFGNNGMTQYTYGDGLISQTFNRNNNGTTTSQSHYLLKDALGSTKALADATGTLTDSYAYDAYGEIIASAGSTPNNYKFAGEQYDADLGMYYNRARYYNQSIGRFSQMDSWQGNATSPITLNKYVYANANPVMYTDPSGNMAIFLSDFAITSQINLTLASITLATGSLYVASNTELYSTLYGTCIASIENQLWTLSENFDNSNKAEKSSERKKYKARCKESLPPNLQGIEKLKWILQRNKDCKKMREDFGNKWFDGIDKAHLGEIENLKRAIQKLEQEITKHGG